MLNSLSYMLCRVVKFHPVGFSQGGYRYGLRVLSSFLALDAVFNFRLFERDPVRLVSDREVEKEFDPDEDVLDQDDNRQLDKPLGRSSFL